jgi:hypothetical protein
MLNDSPIVPAPFNNSASGTLLPYRSNGLAILEGALSLGGLALADYFGVLTLADWPVHPFLFVVILLSAQYGVNGGILAAMGAIIMSHLGGWPARPIDMSYATYFRIAWADSLSWVVAGLMVGVITSHQTRLLHEQAAKLRKATIAESVISAQYEILAQRTHRLERSLAGLAADGSPAPSSPARPKARHNGAGTSH